MPSPIRTAVVLCFAVAACSSRAPTSSDADVDADAGPPPFIAADSDFANFTTWEKFQLPLSDPISDLVYPAGTRIAFLNHRPPHGATRYPIGTIVIKAIELGAGPTDWEIFAMAKRGDDFNVGGALDWEFLLLRVEANGLPHITSRGVAPSDDGRGDAGLPAAAGGYFDTGQIAKCNICHGEPQFAPNDYMMGTQLPPAVTAQ